MQGAVDCDVHVEVPDNAALLPYLSPYWREAIESRAIHRANLALVAAPPNTPLACREDWRPPNGRPGSDLGTLQRCLLNRFGTRIAILNCLHAAQAFPSEDMSAALCGAVNDWLAAEWLDRDTRLRASMLVTPRNPELAVAEIEKRAADPRFVQVLLPLMGDMPLGRRLLWPIYEAAQRHDLPIGIHAGSLYRQAPTAIGWGSSFLEDAVAQSQGAEGQLLSLVAEGVFQRFPRLRVVMIETGFTWLPGFYWRADKTWRGVRAEVPWLERAPSAIVREHVRVTLQPTDAPPEPEKLAWIVERLGSDRMLLFATDFPRARFDGDDAWPAGMPERLRQDVMWRNAAETYKRLGLTTMAAETETVP